MYSKENFKKDIIRYEEEKLEALKLYPPFLDEIEVIREKYKIGPNYYLEQEDGSKDYTLSGLDTFINQGIFYNGNIVINYDEFVQQLNEKFKKKYSLENRADYLIFLTYLIYDRELTLEEYFHYININEKNQFLVNLEKDLFQKSKQRQYNILKDNKKEIELFRKQFEVKNNNFIDDFGYNYLKFKKYFLNIECFCAQPFLIDVKNILDNNKFEILNSKNIWDFYLIYDYIVAIDNTNIKDCKYSEEFNRLSEYFLPKTYEKFDDYLKNIYYDKEYYYLKISKNLNKKTMEIVINNIKNDIFVKKNNSGLYQFYRDKFVYEKYREYKEKGKTNTDFLNDLCNKYKETDFFKSISLCEDQDYTTKMSTIKNIIKSYENKKEKFKKGNF